MTQERSPVAPDGAGADPTAGTSELSANSLCDPFVTLLPISGASVCVIGLNGSQSTVCASDALALQIDGLQFELGEGPHWSAFKDARPVLVEDVQKDHGARWPVLGHALKEIEVGALFAIPLLVGAVVVGVVDLYRATPGWLRPRDLHRAVSLAASVAVPAVHSAVRDAERERPTNTATAPALRREVHQATGMIVVQLDLSPADAFQQLKVEAFLTGRPVHEIARDVVARKIDLGRLRQDSQRTDHA